jgi:flavin-dependent dehydrogenase
MQDAVLEADVFILGAGPAGACAALNLARCCRVLIIDREAIPKPRAGESLPPAANKLLADMGLLEEFKQQGHLACFGNQSRWNSSYINETDFLRDPGGHGWHLDRSQFENWLRQKAISRGATLLAPARLEQLQSSEPDEQGYWQLTIKHGEKIHTVRARVLIDAGGRTPAIAKRLGATRIHRDRLVCSWLIGKDHASAENHSGLSYIESDEQGWWYTAPLPEARRIVAFHTDADHPSTTWMHTAELFLQKIHAHQYLARVMNGGDHARNLIAIEFGHTAANSAMTQPPAGNAWLSVGDAALSFDPLSSQGIFNALYTGLAAAESVYRYLKKEIGNFQEYSAQIERINQAYQAHIQQWYAVESRWNHSPFWQRRRG